MSVPARSATSMTNSPGLASNSRPSMVRDTEVRITSVMGTSSVTDVFNEVVAKHVDGRVNRGGNRRAEHADGRLLGWPSEAGSNVVAEIEQQVEVLDPSTPVLQSVQDALEPSRTFATGRALSAGLASEELGNAPGSAHHAGGLVQHHHGTGTEHRALLAHFVLSERQVEQLRAEPRGRHAAGNNGLDILFANHAAAEAGIVDQITKGVLHHLHFVDPGSIDPTGQGKKSGARRTSRSEGAEGRPAVVDDPRQVRHRFDVVDDGWLAVESRHRRKEGGLDARKAPFAFEALNQGRLFATDVGAGSGMHHDVERKVRAEDLAAQRSHFVGVIEGLLDALQSQRELAAHVDEGLTDLQCVGRDDDALYQLMGIALHQKVILEGRRF